MKKTLDSILQKTVESIVDERLKDLREENERLVSQVELLNKRLRSIEDRLSRIDDHGTFYPFPLYPDRRDPYCRNTDRIGYYYSTGTGTDDVENRGKGL